MKNFGDNMGLAEGLGKLKSVLESRGGEYASRISRIGVRLRDCEGVPADVLAEIDQLTSEVKAGTEIVSMLFGLASKAIEQVELIQHPQPADASGS